MPIPRHLKHPIALWIIDSRKAMEPPMKPADVARAIDVTEATVRAWETARASQTTRLPSSDNLDAMGRLFGSPAPGRDRASDTDLVAAIAGQTKAITALVDEMRQARGESAAALRGVEKALHVVATTRTPAAS